MIRDGLSIIVPAYNEAGTIRHLLQRIIRTLKDTPYPFEILVIDDFSTDSTAKIVRSFSKKFPVKYICKKGKRGKGHSIMEGYTHAKYGYICMIDGDLQYPPEVIPDLFSKAKETGFGVAYRITYKTSLVRRIASRLNAFVFGRLLHNIRTDVQSGLKIFPREVFSHVHPALVTPWAIDIPLISAAYELGHLPGHVNINFHPRTHGSSNIEFFKTAYEIAWGSVKTLLYRVPIIVPPETSDSMLGSGFAYKRNKYITHTTLRHHNTALVTFSLWQITFILAVVCTVLIGALTAPFQTAAFIIAVLSVIYFTDVLFNLYVVLKSLHFPPEITVSPEELAVLTDEDLPMYTIMCPLYHESKVLPQFIEAVRNLNYPKNKLDVLLLLEEDDHATIAAARAMSLPSFVHIVRVPDSQPKTKPKACNYGMGFARGQYTVIYDAEDKPDPDQLRKSVIAFRKSPAHIVCLQAKLNFYNPHDNMLTRFFTAEYSLWFDVILPGLQSIGTTIPLGGTSNHFRTEDLRMLQGWDPFNVTEDCDLGTRLFQAGFKTAIIDSTTLEEANSNVKNWFRQRSRWIKGYFQTYLVHMRNPVEFFRAHGKHSLAFQLIIGGKIAFMLINPILWVVTISYFVLNSIVGTTIEALYPAHIFYIAAFSLVAGNFICIYNYMIGCAKRGHWSLMKYVFFVPLYWLMISYGACIALVQLVFKPHYWEKTVHGLHLDKLESDEKSRLNRLKFSSSFSAQYARIASFAESRIFGGGLLIAGSFIGNFLNFIYNAYLGRHLRIEDFGEIILISSILNMTSIPLGSYMKTITYRSAFLLGMYKEPVRQFWVYQRKIAFAISAALALVWFVSIPFLQDFFRTSDQLPLLLFTPVLLIGLVASVDSGFLSGNLKFKILSVVLFVEPVSKLLITFLLVSLHLNSWVFAAVPASLIISFLAGWLLLARMKYSDIRPPADDIRHFPKRFMTGAILNKISLVLYMNMDILLAKHFLTPADAGLYSFVSLGGKMVYYSSNIFSQFINPLIAHAEGAGKNSTKTFGLLMVPIVLSSVASYILIGIFGKYSVPFLFGAKTLPIVSYLPFYALSIAAFSIASSITTYYLAKRKYVYPIINFCITVIQVGVVIFYHSTITQFITVMVVSGIANLVSIFAVHLYTSRSEAAAAAARQSESQGFKRILIFNWRDTKHKWRGGAEVYIHELAKRWVARGHTVTLFCGNDTLKSRNELVEGVQVIRRGGTFTVYFWAYIYYLFVFKGSYDVIIDSENGIPFFTPLYAREKIFLLIHHVHQEVFRKSLRPPLSWIGILLERRIMPLVYRKIEVITVSPSSKTDILEHKLTTKDPHVVYNGVDLTVCSPGTKHKYPTVLYLGRLTTLKSIDILIHAAKQILDVIPKVRFVIAGDGPELPNLKKLVQSLGLTKHIEFIGKVTEEEKIRLFQESWVFVNPSLIEGWGITTIEANACGTPVVASNVAGLRDAVHNPHSGLLVPYGDVNEFTNAILHLLTNKKVRMSMSLEAVDWAKKYDWEKSAANFEALIAPKRRIDDSQTASVRPYDMTRLLASMTRGLWKSKKVTVDMSGLQFPKSVDGYRYLKTLEKIGPKKSYAIGLYTSDEGETVFAKMRNSSVHDYHYLSLKNEIRMYAILTNVRKRIEFMIPGKFKKISIPQLVHTYEDNTYLIMFLEFKKGRPLEVAAAHKRMPIFFRSVSYLSYLENNMTPQERKNVSKRTPAHFLLLLPFITARTVARDIHMARSIARAWGYIYRHVKTVQSTWDQTLVHRDLHFRNILTSGPNTVVIDLQQCVMTDRLQEYVTLLRYYWKARPEYVELHNSVVSMYKKQPGFVVRMRWLSIHSVIHGLTDPTFPADMTDKWKEYLEYALRPDSFTKEITS